MADNTTTKNYADGTPLFESDLDDLYQDLQVSKSNLAYSTTDSTSGQILQSAGSNMEPSWVSADTVAGNVTSTGANAIFADVTSCVASVANIIGNVMGASGANAIGIAMGSSGANGVVSDLSSIVASVANIIINAYDRSVSTSVGLRGVAISSEVTRLASTSSFSSIADLSITTNGRPVRVFLMASNGSNTSYLACNPTGTIKFQRDSSDIALMRAGTDGASQTFMPPGAFEFIDQPAAGTYTYTALLSNANGGGSALLTACKFAVYEL